MFPFPLFCVDIVINYLLICYFLFQALGRLLERISDKRTNIKLLEQGDKSIIVLS
jgi:hypothetical protein